MSDGGSIVNMVPVLYDGEPMHIEVVTSGGKVEMGGGKLVFEREELLFAIDGLDRA